MISPSSTGTRDVCQALRFEHPAPETGNASTSRGVRKTRGLSHFCVRSRRDKRAMPMQSGHRKSDRPSITLDAFAVKPFREGLQMLPGQVVTQPEGGLNRGLLERWGEVVSSGRRAPGYRPITLSRLYSF